MEQHAGPGTPTPDQGPRLYRAGTLVYTLRQLVVLFAWMIWGEFCFQLMETVFPTLMPLQLYGIGASSKIISIFMRTIPALLVFFLVPVIAWKSDRLRTRWGRRRPLMIVGTPFLVLSLGVLGYVEDVPAFMQAHAGALAKICLSPSTAALLLIGAMVVVFQVVNDIISSANEYYINDVVPQNVMARFLAFGRAKAAVIGIVWGQWIFPCCTFKQIYWGMALVYLAGFTIMVWNVKEGEYPPVPRDSVRQSRLAGAKLFFKESFEYPLFVMLFLFMAVWQVSNACTQFTILYQTKSLGLSKVQIGNIDTLAAVLVILISFPLGWLVDRLTPVRALILGFIINAPVQLARFWVPDYETAFWLTCLACPATHFADAAIRPMMMQLLPRDKFGQFSAATAMVRAGVNSAMPIAGAMFLESMGNNYRYIWVWKFYSFCVAFAILLVLYRMYVKRGGPHHYVPPTERMPGEGPPEGPAFVGGTAP